MEGMESPAMPAPSQTLWDRVVAAVTLKPEVYRQLAADRSATGQAILVVVLAGLIAGLSSIFVGEFGIGDWIGAGIGAIVGVFIFTAIMLLIGKLFGGVGGYMGLLRGLSFAYVPATLGIIPVIGSLVGGIWVIVAAVVAVREIHGISQGKAVATVLIPVGIFLLLALLFFAAALVAMFGARGG
jgi:hypothetical protein